MFEYRVTKYDPAYRDSRGAYTRNEWTSFGDIGRAFSGATLTVTEYERVEGAYVAVAIAFMRENGVTCLTVAGLENHVGVPLAFGEGFELSLSEAPAVIRRVLRGEFWCRLESGNGFLHFGYDYYMYVGVEQRCPAAEAVAHQLGLFVEPFRSPYSEQQSCC